MDKPAARTDANVPPPQASMFGSDADLSGLVVGDFKLLRRIGQGGMGQVYLAEQFSLRRQVALKIVRPELAEGATAATLVARFRAEAEAVARATHANIVQIYAIGQTGDLNYMALEYIEGRNLREFVEKKKPIPVAIGVKIMAQVAAALQRAGELNMVHRDIKPENILVTRNTDVKVADFGLSRCFDRPLGLTRSGMVMGTPLYMSPEQVEQKRPVDHRSDLYAFGATSYFMFAGVPPFRGETPLEVAYQHVHAEPPPLSKLRPDLPTELCVIIHRMMAKKPEARFQTAGEVARAIALVQKRLPSTALRMSPPPTGQTPLLPEADARPWLRRHAVGIGIVALALVCGLFLGWYRQHPSVPAVRAAGSNAADEAARALFSAKERELALLAQLKKDYKPYGPLDKDLAGLRAAVDLGLLYLDERRLDDADTFFKDLCPGGEKSCNGRLLSLLGRAAVLAFRDDPAESNRLFVSLAGDLDKLEKAAPGVRREDIEVYTLFWKHNPPAASVREMVARALNHNLLNDPKNFPKQLEPLRTPPRPVLKSGAAA